MINKIILMGRLVADPELRQTQSGITCCHFRVAVDRPYNSKETGEKQADFINVTAWRSTADFVSKYFRKGNMIIVEGSLRNNDYTDQNGIKHYSMNVQADNVAFGETKSAAMASGNFVAQPSQYNPGAMPPPQYNSGGYQQTPPAQPSSNNETLKIGDFSDFDVLSEGVLSSGNNEKVPF